MSMGLTGIANQNEYYTKHYFSTVFEENAGEQTKKWTAASRESEEIRTPWAWLRQSARQYYTVHDRFVHASLSLQMLDAIRSMADSWLFSLGYPATNAQNILIDDAFSVPVYLEMTKANGAPLLWVILSASRETDAGHVRPFAQGFFMPGQWQNSSG